MAAQRVILTYEDYAALPAEGRRYELHLGELSVTPAPSSGHQEISANLGDLIRLHVRSRGLGKALYAPLDCILSESTVVQPDLVFLETGRLSQLSDRGIEGPPTLVVEITSPSSRQLDRGAKLQLYARYKVPYYWIVDPEDRTIEVFVLVGGGYDLAVRASGRAPVSLPPFPDLRLVPASIWP